MHEKGVREGKADATSTSASSNTPGKKKDEPPAPTPAKREDVVFEVTDKTLQKASRTAEISLFCVILVP